MKYSKIIRDYYEADIDDKAPELTPPDEQIRSIAGAAVFRPVSRWETLVGLVITFGYLAYIINPLNWFSMGRFMFAMMNGFSLSRFVFVFNVGF